MNKLSPEAKEIVRKGFKIVGYTIPLMFITPLVLNYSYKTPLILWAFILGILMTLSCIGLMIWGISNLLKGFFYDTEHK